MFNRNSIIKTRSGSISSKNPPKRLDGDNYYYVNNSIPVAGFSLHDSTPEDSTLTLNAPGILLNATDPDNSNINTFNFIIVNQPANGSVTIRDPPTYASGTFTAEVAQTFSSVEFTGTTEGEPGSMFKLTNIAADVWFIEGTMLSAVTSATPFATS